VSPFGHILLTGATGYVGGRLLIALEAAGYDVRCLARRPEALQHRAGPRVEIVAGDVRDPASLDRALAACDVAYYLVHSMGVGGGFEGADRRAATSFGRAARLAGVRRIIYLGGLGSGSALSSHLASRQEVGRMLAASGVPTMEFRASIVIGSGSLSFEMIRALVERLPVMVAPRWVRTPTQPIAVEDLIAYLLAGLDLDAAESRLFEIARAVKPARQRARVWVRRWAPVSATRRRPHDRIAVDHRVTGPASAPDWGRRPLVYDPGGPGTAGTPPGKPGGGTTASRNQARPWPASARWGGSTQAVWTPGLYRIRLAPCERLPSPAARKFLGGYRFNPPRVPRSEKPGGGVGGLSGG
jgi:uncharacterized protein YbjT (DUF2867 family)